MLNVDLVVILNSSCVSLNPMGHWRWNFVESSTLWNCSELMDLDLLRLENGIDFGLCFTDTVDSACIKSPGTDTMGLIYPEFYTALKDRVGN